MKEETGLVTEIPFGRDLLQQWFKGGAEAKVLDRWIFWNNSPSRHIPVASLNELIPGKLGEILLQDDRTRLEVDAILRAKLSWSAPVAWRPEDPLWEISLALPNRLQRLAFLVAALSMKEVLAKIIDGAVVRKLRQKIGEDIMEFVLLSGSLAKYSFSECAADFPLNEDPLLALQQRAILFIENAFSAKEVGVQQRLASKVPGCFLKGLPQEASPLALKTEELLCRVWKETSSWL